MSSDLLYGASGANASEGACPSDPADPTTAIPANSFAPPAACFNAQLAPLLGQSVRGVLWCE
jgi:hypothetical protein